PFGKAVAAYNPAASPVSIIGLVIRTILSILGVFFIGLMIYGGYLWMTAMGKEQQVTKSKDLITAALIGLIIIVSAYAISYFVTKMFTEEALTPTGGTNQVQTPTGPLPEPIDRPFGTGPGL
ncbi:MAG: hypothetical protein NTW06_02150, partial [Candidatus Falkowbacteria bacterium]|nr:hypothetical protein [Candidatus Falkowbacteria bacterium]